MASSSSKPIPVGTPKNADPKLFSHLNEKERMMQGFPYLPADSGLTLDRAKAHQMNRKFNDSAWDDVEGHLVFCYPIIKVYLLLKTS